MEKKKYLNIVRLSSFLQHFLMAYFIKMVVVYLLKNDVTPWIAVSIPVVLEFSRMISRAFKKIVAFSIKADYRKIHIFHFVSFTLLIVLISQCRSVYTIYLFTILAGFITGVRACSATRLITSNQEYESYGFIEDERASVIGLTLGYILSQSIYDFSPLIYILGYVVIGVISIILCLCIKDVPKNDVMEPLNDYNTLTKTQKNNALIVTILFGILAGLWCISLSALEELAPLITNKVAYLTSIFTIVEFIFLLIISGKLLDKIKKKQRLLLVETIIALVDCTSLLISSLLLSWKGLIISFALSGIFATLGDPIWGSIISSYSLNNRTIYAYVNKIYFITRAIFSVLAWIVCRECVINGIESFKYLAITLLTLIIITYLIANKINKKIFNRTI